MSWLSIFDEAHRNVATVQFGPHITFPMSAHARDYYNNKLTGALKWLGDKWCLYNPRPPKC